MPVTTRVSNLYRAAPWLYGIRLVRRFAHRASPAVALLCPVQPAIRAPVARHLDVMLRLARAARSEGAPYLEFMVHSSELMASGSPTFRSQADIECLYEHLEMLFEELSAWCDSTTLAEFYELYTSARPRREGAEAYPARRPGARAAVS